MLDLRTPIGVYFLLNCVILVIVGIKEPTESNIGGYMINLNLLWGIVMGVFGAFMLSLVMMDKNKPHITATKPDTEASTNE
ncbi:MAG: hypothetical protein K2X77_28730 [Candidatus Obscuribacterales bacterium]|nr:hypothetical protein [Candidatus Obscuribacterales bacterium]